MGRTRGTMNHSAKRSSRGRRGFSLAELLVVIVIVGFASSMAILSYSQFRQAQNVRSEADKIKALLVNARTRAIAEGDPVQVVFDLTNQAMWVDDLEEGTRAVIRPKVIAPEAVNEQVVLEAVQVGGDPEVTDDLAYAIFDATGTNPFITIILRRADDDPSIDENYTSIQLYPSSAEPKIWPNERR